VVIRPVQPGDREGILAMFERCSPQTRFGRFHSPVRLFPAAHLEAVVQPSPDVAAFVAVTATGTVVALASIHRVGDVAGEIGLLVEDRWQRRRLGSGLLACLVTAAGHLELREMHASIHAEVRWVLALLRARLPGMHARHIREIYHVRAAVPMVGDDTSTIARVAASGCTASAAP
jgi:L-amino acid N-acyltransferase YncA